MRGFVRLMAVVVTAAVFVVACSKDKDSGKITLDSPAVFFAQAGGSATVGFTAQNIKTLSATSKPTGWDEAVVDLAGATISVKAPSAEDIESGDAVKTGSFSFTGYTPGGTLVSATLFAGIVTTKDISAEVANSYIVTEPETNYLIDATRKGDGSQLATSYVNVVWQTASGFVQYADFEDGKASFYIGADSDDALEPFIKAGASRIPEITRYVPSGGFTGSEDAAHLMSRVQAHGGKAAYMCIGCDIAAPHHNARFDIDENALMTGLKLYVSVLWELLGQKQ